MDVIKVYIVDDNFIARRGLRSVLEAEDGIAVVGEASSGSEALMRLHDCPADVVLMDIRMSDIDGISATAALLRERPGTRVLMATVIEDPVVHMNAMMAGARGYLVYGRFAPEALTDAIRAVACGQRVNIPPIPEETSRESESGCGGLTQREDEIMRLIAAGKDNRQIAAALNIEEKTVKNHINNIYSKIGLSNRQEAINYMLNIMFKETP
jgi:DNA-binding NarL/FixJ family response regulator